MPIQRFPRWNLTKEEKLVWALLRVTFNRMAMLRSVSKREMKGGWDVYNTKIGLRAKYAFLMLTPQLIEREIDPSLYIKVMCKYGQFKRSQTMPHPIFLASQKALDIFAWKVKSERKTYGLKEEWKKSLEGELTSGEIYAAVKSGARIFKEARRQLGVTSSQTFLAIFKDLSPAFTAAYVKESKSWKPLLYYLRLYRSDRKLRIAAKRAIRSEFKTD